MNISLFAVCLMAIALAAPTHSSFNFKTVATDTSLGIGYEYKCDGILAFIGWCKNVEEKPKTEEISMHEEPRRDRREILTRVLNTLNVQYAEVLEEYRRIMDAGDYSHGSGKSYLDCRSLHLLYKKIEEVLNLEQC